MKMSNDVIWIQTRDLPACSIATQPTTLLRAADITVLGDDDDM
jgi:hypothetical protein